MRKDMVTRTVVGTQATVKVVNTSTEAITREEVLLNKTYEDTQDKKLINAIKKSLPDDVVIIKVESLVPMNKLYGVETSKFMENAVELDPVTRKPIQ